MKNQSKKHINTMRVMQRVQNSNQKTTLPYKQKPQLQLADVELLEPIKISEEQMQALATKREQVQILPIDEDSPYYKYLVQKLSKQAHGVIVIGGVDDNKSSLSERLTQHLQSNKDKDKTL